MLATVIIAYCTLQWTPQDFSRLRILSPALRSTYSAAQLTVRILADQELPPGLQMSVRLKSPTGAEHVVPLRDDGVFPDESKGDNIWTGVFAGTPQRGTWQLLFIKTAIAGRQGALVAGGTFVWSPDVDATTLRPTRTRIGSLVWLQAATLLVLVVGLAAVFLQRTFASQRRRDVIDGSPSATSESPWQRLENISSELLYLRDAMASMLTQAQDQGHDLKNRLSQVLKQLLDIKTEVVDPFAADQQAAALVAARIQNLFTLFGVEPLVPPEGTRYDELLHRVTQKPSGPPPYRISKTIEPGWQLKLPQGEVIVLLPATVEVSSESGA